MLRTQILSQPALIIAFAACIGSCLLALFVRRSVRAAADGHASIRKMEERLAVAEKNLGFAMQIVSDQSRRFAVLESRSRIAKPQASSPVQAEPADRNASGMDEKKYSVLAMARRGMDTGTIAERLSMPYGEVELIISLSAVA